MNYIYRVGKKGETPHRSPLTKLTQGKNQRIAANFLEANFEHFRFSTVGDDKNEKNF